MNDEDFERQVRHPHDRLCLDELDDEEGRVQLEEDEEDDD